MVRRKLEGKVAVITAATSGMALATAKLFVETSKRPHTSSLQDAALQDAALQDAARISSIRRSSPVT
jgi:NAD(P)-dependent dehydrogenase (short-subunit alcohol dehydrogenase family)